MNNQIEIFKDLSITQRYEIVSKWDNIHRGFYAEELARSEILNNGFIYAMPSYPTVYDMLIDHKYTFFKNDCWLNHHFFRVQVKSSTQYPSKNNSSIVFDLTYGQRVAGKRFFYLNKVDLFALVDPVTNIIAWKGSTDENIYNRDSWTPKRKEMKLYTLKDYFINLENEINSKDQIIKIIEEDQERDKNYNKLLQESKIKGLS